MLPKFVETISGDSSDEDEIQFVPYVKPAPPVIDIIDDTSGGEETFQFNFSVENHKDGKRKKKKRSKESKRGQKEKVGDTDCDNNVASSRSITSPSRNNVIDQIDEQTIPNGEVNQDIEQGDSNVELTGQSLGSVNNVDAPSTCPVDNISSVVETLPSIRIANSIFESRDVGVQRVDNPISIGIETVTQPNSTSGSKRRKPGCSEKLVDSAAIRKDGLQSTNKRKSNPSPKPPRANKRQKATTSRRTDEEILNFLTTLGVPFETQDLPSLTPKRVRKPKKKLENTSATSSASAPPDVEAVIKLLGVDTVCDSNIQSRSTSSTTTKAAVDGELGLVAEVNSSKSISEVPIINDEHISSTLVPGETPTISSTSVHEETPVISSTSVHEETPVISSTSVHEETPVISSTSVHEETPAISSSTSPSTVNEDPIMPTIETNETDTAEHISSNSETLVVENTSSPSLPSQTTAEQVLNNQLPYLPAKWNQEMIEYYDYPLPEFTVHETMKRLSDDPKLWYVRPTFPRPKVKKIRCLNCQQYGHLARTCKEKRKETICLLCGRAGHSVDRGVCPMAMCLSCGRKQSRVTNGCNRCMHSRAGPLRCQICNVVGHDSSLCPDNWRRFYSTISSNTNVDTQQFFGDRPRYRDSEDMYCSNCGKKGHNYYYCKMYYSNRMNKFQYHRNKPNIIKELKPPPRAKSCTVTKSDASERTVMMDFENRMDEEEGSSSSSVIKVVITNENALSSRSVSIEPEKIGNEWTCLEYPDCQNKPSIGNSCHSLFVVPAEHSLMLEAQKSNKLAPIKEDHKVDVTVLHNRGVIHIWGNNHVAAKEDLLRLINRLKRAQVAREAAVVDRQIPETTTTTTPESQNRNKNRGERSTNAVDTGDQGRSVLPSPQSPEVINLDDDEEDDSASKEAEAVLTVALLESEWDLIFEQSVKSSGLISILSKQFKVNIFVSKESLTATIQDGAADDRKIAQKNIVNWLECQAAGVEYTMKRSLNEAHPNIPTIARRIEKRKRGKVNNSPLGQRKRQRERPSSDNNEYVLGGTGATRQTPPTTPQRNQNKFRRGRRVPPKTMNQNDAGEDRDLYNQYNNNFDVNHQGNQFNSQPDLNHHNPHNSFGQFYPNPAYYQNQRHQADRDPQLNDRFFSNSFIDFSLPSNSEQFRQPSYGNNSRSNRGRGSDRQRGGNVGNVRGRLNKLRYYNANM